MAPIDDVRWGSPEWIKRFIARQGFAPIAGGDDDPPADPPKADPPADDPPDPPDDPDKVRPEDDWKEKARKHERALKRERERAAELEKQLKVREDANKSEHEKALEKAREEARTQALSEAEKERRADRLEVAVTRHAAKGVTVGEGDDAKTVSFADSEDALVNLQAAVAKGDIDADEIYDSQGQVNTEALQDALRDLLRRKPHLAAGESKPKPGDPDARKGDPPGDLESKSVEDHIKRKYATT